MAGPRRAPVPHAVLVGALGSGLLCAAAGWAVDSVAAAADQPCLPPENPSPGVVCLTGVTPTVLWMLVMTPLVCALLWRLLRVPAPAVVAAGGLSLATGVWLLIAVAVNRWGTTLPGSEPTVPRIVGLVGMFMVGTVGTALAAAAVLRLRRVHARDPKAERR